MKIPGTDIYCTFHTSAKYPSIEKVPYWRLYTIRKEKVQTKYGTKIVRTVVNKCVANYNFDILCTLIKSLGQPGISVHIDGVTYSYEAYPRSTVFNRAI